MRQLQFGDAGQSPACICAVSVVPFGQIALAGQRLVHLALCVCLGKVAVSLWLTLRWVPQLRISCPEFFTAVIKVCSRYIADSILSTVSKPFSAPTIFLLCI